MDPSSSTAACEHASCLLLRQKSQVHQPVICIQARVDQTVALRIIIPMKSSPYELRDLDFFLVYLDEVGRDAFSRYGFSIRSLLVL